MQLLINATRFINEFPPPRSPCNRRCRRDLLLENALTIIYNTKVKTPKTLMGTLVRVIIMVGGLL